MSRALSSARGLFGKQDVLLVILCVLLAVAFLGLAASNLSGGISGLLSIDGLFLTAVALTMALVFITIPVMYLRERGMLNNPFTLGEGVPAARTAEAADLHFEGTTKLFLSVLGALLVLTIVEVMLAYIKVSLVVMLTLLIGLSLIKAALIIAYFMHLRFERLSLVLTLIPILCICICLLFVFFPDSRRSHDLRAVQVKDAVEEAR
jgi:cytochrome c oxidase subunit 4